MSGYLYALTALPTERAPGTYGAGGIVGPQPVWTIGRRQKYFYCAAFIKCNDIFSVFYGMGWGEKHGFWENHGVLFVGCCKLSGSIFCVHLQLKISLCVQEF
jgi:hypothetical protein